ncbi:hypothetical protein fh0823_27940 (plasmid) [Francisella halioticida]|uniref:hypothetical protein n=1 Tax=Francisella halioticida TaxID=549298 RepID=UPI001AFC2BFA|nr:hypothetical protein [Francisella halioticida]BCD92657.1 hypothetical protein fh0823_27940 [Francisella halioticida]
MINEIFTSRVKKIREILINKKEASNNNIKLINEPENKTTMSIRVDDNLRNFYQALASETENSLQGSMVLALKDYRDLYMADEVSTKLKDQYSEVFNNIFKIFERSHIPFVKWNKLLEGLSGQKIDPENIINTTSIVNICTDEFIKNICSIFDVGYSWLIGTKKYNFIPYNYKHYGHIRHHYFQTLKKILNDVNKDKYVIKAELILVDEHNIYRDVLDKKLPFENDGNDSFSLYLRCKYEINSVKFDVIHTIEIGLPMKYKPCHDDIFAFLELFRRLREDNKNGKLEEANCISLRNKLNVEELLYNRHDNNYWSHCRNWSYCDMDIISSNIKIDHESIDKSYQNLIDQLIYLGEE